MVSQNSLLPAARSGQVAVAEKLLITLGALIVYRLGCFAPLPGLDLQSLVGHGPAGPALVGRLSIFALGVTPIFSALFLFETVKLIFPSLDGWANRSPANRTLARRYVIGLSLLLALLRANGLATALERVTGLVEEPGAAFRLSTFAILLGATAFLAWLGERISRDGLGTGFWLLLLAPRAAGLGRAFGSLLQFWARGLVPASTLVVWLAFLVAAIALIVLALETQRLDDVERDRGGDDFAIVWTPLLATSIGGTLFAFLPMVFGRDPYDGDAASLLRLLLIALLIVAVGWRRRAFAPSNSRARVRSAAILAVQLAVTLGAALVARYFTAPFVLDGPILFILVAAGVDFLRSFRRALGRSS